MKSSACNLLLAKVSKLEKKYSKSGIKDNQKSEQKKGNNLSVGQTQNPMKSKKMFLPLKIENLGMLSSEEEIFDVNSQENDRSVVRDNSENFNYIEQKKSSSDSYDIKYHGEDYSSTENTQDSVDFPCRENIHEVSDLLNENYEANSVHNIVDEKTTDNDVQNRTQECIEKMEDKVSSPWQGRILDISSLLNENADELLNDSSVPGEREDDENAVGDKMDISESSISELSEANSVHNVVDEKTTDNDVQSKTQEFIERVEDNVNSPWQGRILDISSLLNENADGLFNDISVQTEKEDYENSVNDKMDRLESTISELSNLGQVESVSDEEKPELKLEFELNLQDQDCRVSQHKSNKDNSLSNFNKLGDRKESPVERNKGDDSEFVHSLPKIATAQPLSLSTISSVEEQDQDGASYSSANDESSEYPSDFENSLPEDDSSDSEKPFQDINSSKIQEFETHASSPLRRSTSVQLNTVSGDLNEDILGQYKELISKAKFRCKSTQTVNVHGKRQNDNEGRQPLEAFSFIDYGGNERKAIDEMPSSLFSQPLNLLNGSSSYGRSNFHSMAQQKISIIKYFIDKQWNLYKAYMNAAADLSASYEPVTLHNTKKLIEKTKRRKKKR